MHTPRCYLIPQVLEKLQMKERTFYDLRKAGRLPCLEEIRPRLGRIVRYRADLIDRYLENQFRSQPRAVRRSA